MENSITMIKYQGLGNDYLVLDPNKNRVQLQEKRLLSCVREDSDLARTVCFTDRSRSTEKWVFISIIPMEAKLRSVETVFGFLRNI